MGRVMGSVLRSLVFYLVFYSGTVFYVLLALAMLPFSRTVFMQVIRGWSRFHRSCVTGLLGIEVIVHGTPPPGDVLVAMKHESFFEAIDLPSLLGSPVVFAKVQLLRIPLWGDVARAYGMVPVERDKGAKALRAMISAARGFMGQGRGFIIFPEGTRVPPGTQPPLQAGFAGLYKLLGLPVVPVAVDSGRFYHRRWKRRGTITISFGEPIPAGLTREEIEARVHAAINVLSVGSA
jgi:1-acyl-sn-glycerol-3-phosphate acyltransferase